MVLDEAGVQLIAAGVAAYIGDLNKADSATTGFYGTLGKSDKAAGGFQQVMIGALREVGAALVDFGAKGAAAIGGFVKDSVSVAGDFEQEFAQFDIAVGHTIDNTGLKLDDFKKLFISLGKELPVSTAEVEKAAIEMARGGIDPATIAAGGLKDTIQFASAALKGDLVAAAQISAKTMQAWTNITDSAATKTEFLSHAQNLMTQATTAASTTVDQLFLGLSNVGGTARLAGVSFDQTVAALAQLTPSFASSADAGTSFKTFLARLQPETKPAIAAMEGLGLYTEQAGSAFYDAQGKFIGMGAAEDLLQKATANLTDAQRESVLQTIFGQDAIRTAGVFAMQGKAGYDALTDSISKQTTLQDAAAKVQATYNTSLENAKGSVEALQITIGSALLPVLADLLNNYIAPAVNAVTDFASSILDATDPMLSFASAIHQWDAPLGSIVFYLTELARGGEGVDAWLKETPPLFQGLVSAIGSAADEFFRLSGAFDIGGISGLISTIVSDVQSALPGIEKAFLAWGQSLIDWVQPYIPPMIDALQGAVDTAWAWVKQQVPGWIQQLGVWGDALGGWIAPYIPVVVKMLGGLVDDAWAWVKQQAPGWLAQLNAWGQSLADWIAPYIPPMLKALVDMVNAAWDWVKQQAPGWGKQLLAWGDELVAWVAPMIPPALTELGKLGTQLIAWIGDQSQPLLKKLGDWATSFIAWIPGATVTFLAQWPKMFDQFLDWIGNEAGPLLKKLGDWAVSFVEWIAPMIPPFLIALAGVALAITTWIGETALVLVGKIKDKWLPAIIGWVVTDAIPGLAKALYSLLQSFDDWIKDAEKQIAAWMHDLGVSAVEGIKEGLSSAWGSLTHWLTDKAKSMVNAALDAIGAHSPATEFMPVGAFAVQGIIAGFQNAWPSLQTFLEGFGSDLASKAQSIADQVQGIIADSFGATASIDRQAAANLDKLKDVLPQYLDYTKGALAQAQQQALQFADPAEGAKFYALRSKQILEYAKLQKDLADAETQEDKDRIQQQMLLINAAQQAELSQVNASKAVTTPEQNIAKQINDVLAALTHYNLTDNQIAVVGALSGLFAQLSQPQANPYANPVTTVPAPTTNSTTLNMPIYSNNSPGAMQDSMAIAMAGLI